MVKISKVCMWIVYIKIMTLILTYNHSIWNSCKLQLTLNKLIAKAPGSISGTNAHPFAHETGPVC